MNADQLERQKGYEYVKLALQGLLSEGLLTEMEFKEAKSMLIGIVNPIIV